VLIGRTNVRQTTSNRFEFDTSDIGEFHLIAVMLVFVYKNPRFSKKIGGVKFPFPINICEADYLFRVEGSLLFRKVFID
jgi:hypothetical protein